MHFNNGDEDVADGDVMMTMRLAHDALVDDVLMMTAPSLEVVNKRAAHGRNAVICCLVSSLPTPRFLNTQLFLLSSQLGPACRPWAARLLTTSKLGAVIISASSIRSS